VLATAVAALWLRAGRAPVVRVAAVREAGGGPAEAAVLNASGYVTARRRATVSSKITGKLVEVLVEEGMPVRDGQVLARLDDAQARATLDLTEAQLVEARRAVHESEVNLALAELTLERTSRLAADGVVGQAELDASRAQAEATRARLAVERERVEVAEREVALRRTELADTVVRAPFEGIVVSKDAQPGEMVSPISAGGGFTRTGICSIVDMGSLEIEVDVNESYISRVLPGQKVTAVLDAYPEWRIPAAVITTIPTADRQKATVKVRIGFEQPDPRILPEMGIKVSFLEAPPTAGEAARARLIVPLAAVRQQEGRSTVFVVDGRDRAERRAVSVGPAHGDEVEVVSGLTAGERVVIDGPADLSDGDRVKIR
jgi:RND family efflux transporter MFP subunit